MYQKKYPKMIISIGIYDINRPEAGYGRGGLHIYIYICACICECVYSYIHKVMQNYDIEGGPVT